MPEQTTTNEHAKKKRVRKPTNKETIKAALDTWRNAIGRSTILIDSLTEKYDQMSDCEAKTKLGVQINAEQIKLERAKEKAKAAQERLTAWTQRDENKSRKERTHRLIQLGALVEKAGVGNWPQAQLLGGLLAMKGQVKLFEEWIRKGNAILYPNQ